MGGSPLAAVLAEVGPTLRRVRDQREMTRAELSDHVLAGEMRLIVADHDITMGPGEVAELDTAVPHWFGAAGDEPVELLSLRGQSGERTHVRAAPRRRTPGG